MNVNALRDVHFFGHGASRHRRTVTRRGSSLASVDDGTKDNIWIKYWIFHGSHSKISTQFQLTA